MKERKAEIRVCKEALNLKKRLALNECSELRCAIAERKSRIQNLQTRYIYFVHKCVTISWCSKITFNNLNTKKIINLSFIDYRQIID